MEEGLNRIEEKMDTLNREVLLLAKTVGVTGKSVDDLTLAVAQGFAKTEERFENIDQQFEGANGKIEGLHRRMDAELEQKRVVEDRVSKIEVVVFPSLAK